MNNCPHCGTSMFMTWISGMMAWLCPRRNDGHHPTVVITTSNNTSGTR